MSTPLNGLLVADFSRVLAGPLATTFLADLGARVIKVERPEQGDDTRHWGPPWTTRGSSYFESANRSKESIELDLKDSDDLSLAHELAHRADVVVENHRDKVLDALELDYASVRTHNPGVVYCSISGFGSGAGAAMPGYDFLVQAMGGLMSITGPADGEPTKVGVALVDVLTGKDAVAGILAALRHRDQTGAGQHVEVNLLSSLLGSLANQASAYLATGESPQRMGNEHPSIAPYETLRCRDGAVAVACGNDEQFRRLATALGRAELADDQRFVRNQDRVANRTALIAELESVLSADDVTTWVDALGAAGVPAGEVGDIGSALDLAGDLGLAPVADAGDGTYQIRHPISYSASELQPPGPPPGLGQHNAAIRAWLREAADERAAQAGPRSE